MRRMTSLPAARLKLFDRGLLRPRMAADVVVFDPAANRGSVRIYEAASIFGRDSARVCQWSFVFGMSR